MRGHVGTVPFVVRSRFDPVAAGLPSRHRRVLFFDVSRNSSTHPGRPQRRTRDRSRRVASSTASASASRIRSCGAAASTGVLPPLTPECASRTGTSARIASRTRSSAASSAIDDLTACIAQSARPSHQLPTLACWNSASPGVTSWASVSQRADASNPSSSSTGSPLSFAAAVLNRSRPEWLATQKNSDTLSMLTGEHPIGG